LRIVKKPNAGGCDMNSLTCKEKTFKEIEREFFEIGCEIARELMAAFLSKVDKELGEARDKSQLRHKGKRNTSIKTLMGEVPVRRALYKRIKEDGSVATSVFPSPVFISAILP
jgi:hypothetical protein